MTRTEAIGRGLRAIREEFGVDIGDVANELGVLISEIDERERGECSMSRSQICAQMDALRGLLAWRVS